MCIFYVYIYRYLVYTSRVVSPLRFLHHSDDQRLGFAFFLIKGTEIGTELASEQTRREREYVRGGRQVVEGHKALLVIQEDAHHFRLASEGHRSWRGRHGGVALAVVVHHHPVVCVGLEHDLPFPLRVHRRHAEIPPYLVADGDLPVGLAGGQWVPAEDAGVEVEPLGTLEYPLILEAILHLLAVSRYDQAWVSGARVQLHVHCQTKCFGDWVSWGAGKRVSFFFGLILLQLLLKG